MIESIEPESTSRRGRSALSAEVFSWALYDAANSGFSVLIVTFAFPLYFQQVVAGGSDFSWGLAVSISMLVAALIAPPLGAAADYSASKKRFLFAFTLASVLSTALLFFVGPGQIVPAFLLFVVANVGFEAGIVFYDALLPEISTPRNLGRVSGFGFAMGYLGGLAILALCSPLLKGGLEPGNLPRYRASFLVTALFFFLLALPLFLFVGKRRRRSGSVSPTQPEGERQASEGLERRDYWRAGFRRTRETIRRLARDRDLGRFLLAFFFYNDAILTLIAFAGLYARTTFGLTVSELVVFFAMVYTAAAVGSFLFGFVTDWIGPKKAVLSTLLLWMGLVLILVLTESKAVFYLVGCLAGIGSGSCLSSSRSLMALLTPPARSAEYFGLYDGLFGKSSAIVGPFLFGATSRIWGQRAAVAGLLVFFVLGFWLLSAVRVPRPEKSHESPRPGTGRATPTGA